MTAAFDWQEYELKVESTWRFVICLLALAALLLIALPCANALRPASDSMAQWFQRTGAPVTVFAFLAQNKAGHLSALLTPGGFGSAELVLLRKQYMPKQKWGMRVSIGLTVVGTIVWAYGDILFNNVARLVASAAA
ncbi:hypothetical protein AB3K92_35445 [Burkholderia sp. Bmkn7]|uniref:hypothetical protein n=1 Tax=Burkholderia sp. Bmkn7 TaxID=3236841 RepID=UPI0034E4CE07